MQFEKAGVNICQVNMLTLQRQSLQGEPNQSIGVLGIFHDGVSDFEAV